MAGSDILSHFVHRSLTHNEAVQARTNGDTIPSEQLLLGSLRDGAPFSQFALEYTRAPTRGLLQPCRISLGDDTSCVLLSSGYFSAPHPRSSATLDAPNGPRVVACASLHTRARPSWVDVPKLCAAGEPAARAATPDCPDLVWFYARWNGNMRSRMRGTRD